MRQLNDIFVRISEESERGRDVPLTNSQIPRRPFNDSARMQNVQHQFSEKQE